jgi:hypothetical protein
MGIRCPACKKAILPLATIATGKAQPCPHCGTQLKRPYSINVAFWMFCQFTLIKYALTYFFHPPYWLAMTVALSAVLVWDILTSSIQEAK